MKLGEAIRIMLCEVAQAQHAGVAVEKRCQCEDPWPREYGCAYGSCVIIRCALCGRLIRFKAGECHFPYS